MAKHCENNMDSLTESSLYPLEGGNGYYPHTMGDMKSPAHGTEEASGDLSWGDRPSPGS